MPSQASTPYEPDAPLELVELSGAIPHKEVFAKHTQLWLMQIPAEVDLKELTGGKLKLTEPDNPNDTTLATFKAPSGSSFQVFAEDPILSAQLYAAAPKGSAKLSDLRKIDRRVTWVSSKIAVEAAAVDSDTIPKVPDLAAPETPSAKKHKAKKHKDKKRKSGEGVVEEEDTPRKSKRKDKSR